MSGYKRIPLEIKEQILSRLKEGVSVTTLAREHGISTNAIYHWIEKQSGQNPGVLQISRLKRERDDLLKIVGEMALKLSKREKNLDSL